MEASERILIVEDSATQAQYLRLVLEDEGYDVEIATNGRTALSLVQSSQPDLVLSDIIMPEMDGLQFCRAMKADASTREIPLVMVSSLQAKRDRMEALENGADDFLNKPIDPDELVARVRSLIRIKALSDQLISRERQGARRILLVVSAETDVAQLREPLERETHIIEIVQTGEAALQKIRESAPDLVIAASDLPDIDGFEFCQAVKSADSTRRVPVVMLEAAESREGRGKAIDAGADDFLANPIDKAELLARVRSLLRVKGLYDQLAQSDNEIDRQAKELAATNAELRKLATELEERVQARTAELQAKTEEMQAMSQQLWQTAKLATMGELAASIAHELNNPLATVSLRIESMLLGAAPDDPNHRALEIIDGEVERMGRLVARLLEFSRRGEQQVSTISIPSEVDSALELVQSYLRNRSVTPQTEYGPGDLMVHADRQQLRQVLLNLITNACDAMPDGGTLSIRVRRAVEAPAPGTTGQEAGVIRPPEVIVLEISDTGTGIPPEILNRVLEPFFTTKPEGKGTGLGLPICRRVIQEHNGKMEIESEVGKGTTFRVTLPASSNGDPNHGRS